MRQVVSVGALVCVMALGIPAVAADIQVISGDLNQPSFIEINGEIKEGDADRFYELSEHIDKAMVVLSSPGGGVTEALSIASEISIRGFTTFVSATEGCYSACALIWVSGASRVMDAKSTIGVHAAYVESPTDDGSLQALESGAANADIGAFLNQLGLSREAIQYFTRADPGSFYYITPEIAQRIDIDVTVIDGDNLSLPQDRPTPRQLMRQTANYLGLSSFCAEEMGIDSEWLRAAGGERLRIGHEMFSPELYIDLTGEAKEIQKSQVAALGKARWCLGAEYELRDAGLPTGIDGPSFRCTQATTASEKAICATPDLWAIDRMMDGNFNSIRDSAQVAEMGAVNEKQREWLARREVCASDIACIAKRYQAWLLDHEMLVADLPRN